MSFKKAQWVVSSMFRDIEPVDVRKYGRIVSYDEKHPDELRNVHTLFRIEFENPDSRTVLRYSADDIAKIYVNGTFLDMGPAPSYHFNYGYLEIDITDYLVGGTNIVGAHVYYQGELNRLWPSGDFRTGFAAEIESENEILAFTDGKTRCKQTDAYGKGDIIAYRTQYLEHFDMNKWDIGWAKADFDDSSWENSCIKKHNDYTFSRQISKRLQFYDVTPVKEVKTAEKAILYDLGCEYTGMPYICATGKAGDVIEIRCSEELTDEGRARYEMRCNCIYLQTFTLAGTEREYTEFYDYMAFRYIEVICPDGVDIHVVKMTARNYPFDYKSTSFESQNTRMNGIWNICKNGVRTGTQEGILDCPTREKGLYLGDMTVSGQSHFYLTGELLMMKRALKGFSDSIYYTTPIQTYAIGHLKAVLLDYSFQYPLNLLFYYKHSGDKEFLKEMLPACETMMNHFRQFDKGGLIYDNTTEGHLVDWPRDPYDFTDGYDYNLDRFKTKGTHNVANIFYICGQQCMNEIYEILGMEYEDRLPTMKKAYLDAFYNPEKKLFTDTIESEHTALHSNILPLYFGVAPEESIPEIIKMVEEKRLNCGVYIAYFLLKALCRNDRKDLAIELILSDHRFSWGTMLKQGATTCFEVWDKEYKWNTSLCHPWASSPISILIEDIMGVSPSEPGWTEFNTSPYGLDNLGDFELIFHVNGYRIKASGKNNNYKFERLL
ncbi:MAG: family 78 glycoside hydrolase catalytic domain [Clostridiales bacterium]|nr:family 78 glycoside hydrolase catalytic domain [Clostridiales bacterium]